MQLTVTCPKCGKELRAAPELQGKRVACPRCGESFRVPAPANGPPPVSAPGPLRVAPPPVGRTAQAAKFIAGEATETRVHLGADGCLPELVFQDQVAEQEPHETNPRESKPLLLIGVLCFSITLSVILLVFEPQKVQSDDAAKAEARRQIATFYLGVGPTLKPYEKRLREALQAYHRHDQDAARRHCREVLDMLHNESHQGAAGLTGMRTAQKAPNDQHLEQQLAILMSRD